MRRRPHPPRRIAVHGHLGPAVPGQLEGALHRLARQFAPPGEQVGLPYEGGGAERVEGVEGLIGRQAGRKGFGFGAEPGAELGFGAACGIRVEFGSGSGASSEADEVSEGGSGAGFRHGLGGRLYGAGGGADQGGSRVLLMGVTSSAPVSSRAYASRLVPRGVVRPFSHQRTVARVTPNAGRGDVGLAQRLGLAQAAALLGEGSGVSGVRVMADPIGCPLVRKST